MGIKTIVGLVVIWLVSCMVQYGMSFEASAGFVAVILVIMAIGAASEKGKD